MDVRVELSARRLHLEAELEFLQVSEARVVCGRSRVTVAIGDQRFTVRKITGGFSVQGAILDMDIDNLRFLCEDILSKSEKRNAGVHPYMRSPTMRRLPRFGG